MIQITGLYIYPIKSIRALALAKSEVDKWGLQHDRRYMLVDQTGRFLSQRQQPKMALIEPHQTATGWLLTAPGMSAIFLPFSLDSGATRRVKIWDDECESITASESLSNWFASYLGMDCTLVFFPDVAQRQVDLNYANAGIQTSFSDGFPILLTQRSSLDQLNAELDQPVDMLRFRPNIVVSGGRAFEEDQWKKIQIGSISFDVVKPCSRCVIPSLDIETGKPGQQPILQVLINQRRAADGKVYFGQNLIHCSEGRLNIGDGVSCF